MKFKYVLVLIVCVLVPFYALAQMLWLQGVQAKKRQMQMQAPTPDPFVTNGLVGWWKLDDGSGTSVIDSTGTTNTGTLLGSPTWTAGRVGASAIQLSGTNQYVNIPRADAFDLSGAAITLALWIKTPGAVSDGFSDAVASRDSITTGSRVFLLQHTASNSKLAFYCWNTANTNISPAESNAAISDNAWHHVAAAYNGTNLLLYVDGGQQTVKGVLTGNLKTSMSIPFRIGHVNTNDLRYFRGSVDDIRIYNRVLTQDEIDTLAAQ
ncbi:MAG TPA: LamG domain-containing protein [Verrucomicrobiae bacterium]|nr:LamG domain-containing protein [Verrucomicrobiae bacterium]